LANLERQKGHAANPFATRSLSGLRRRPFARRTDPNSLLVGTAARAPCRRPPVGTSRLPTGVPRRASPPVGQGTTVVPLRPSARRAAPNTPGRHCGRGRPPCPRARAPCSRDRARRAMPMPQIPLTPAGGVRRHSPAGAVGGPCFLLTEVNPIRRYGSALASTVSTLDTDVTFSHCDDPGGTVVLLPANSTNSFCASSEDSSSLVLGKTVE
jgi:hypothetical protein